MVTRAFPSHAWHGLGESQAKTCHLVGFFLALSWLWTPVTVSAGTIDTAFLEAPWPGQWVRESEVHKYRVRWRQRLDRTEGLFVGLRFTAPTDRQTTWGMATDFTEIGGMTPHISAVRYLEDTATRQVIQVDVKVLWATFQLNFEIEKEPPNAIRFRLVNTLLGEYRAVALLKEPTEDFHSSEPANTLVELVTWLKPARPVPLRLLASLERGMFLRATREFLQACEQAYLQRVGASHGVRTNPRSSEG